MMKPLSVGVCIRFKPLRGWRKEADGKYNYYKLLRRKKIKKKKGIVFIYDVEAWEYQEWNKQYEHIEKNMSFHQIRTEFMNNLTAENLGSDVDIDAEIALAYLIDFGQ